MAGPNWELGKVTTKGVFGSRWWLILVGLAVGGVLGLADFIASGSPSRGVTDVAIVVGYTLFLAVFRSRSETASVLAGFPVDERWQAINLHALAAAGLIAALVALGGLVVAESTGHDASGFGIVAGAVGVAYIGGVIWYRWRL
jgi:hypothetical protein